MTLLLNFIFDTGASKYIINLDIIRKGPSMVELVVVR
jgi:hypothetical protein